LRAWRFGERKSESREECLLAKHVLSAVEGARRRQVERVLRMTHRRGRESREKDK
jgi:hypothetical protein